MLKKISVFTLLLSLLLVVPVALVPTCSARAEESVVEWHNFGEYWIAQGKAIENLPFEYNSEKQYMYYRSSSTSYIFIWDSSVTKYCSQSGYSSNSFFFYWNNCDAVYYSKDTEATWSNIVNQSSKYVLLSYSVDAYRYSDISFKYSANGGSVSVHATKTGTNVSFEFALADMSDSLKTTLQSYEYYVVAKVPYRVNDWKSEQIMIAVSNGSKVVYRSEAYNQIQFSTGSGYEAGLSYIYCSECCKWEAFNSEKAYILGDTVASGGRYPDILWTNCDIYYEDGTSYGLTDEIYYEAYPYNEDDIEEEEPQEVVTDGFPRLFEVIKPVAFVYESKDSTSNIILAMVDGSSGLAIGVEYDSGGNAWYKVIRYSNSVGYEGYITPDSVSIGVSAPSIGDSSDGSESFTPTPTPTPSSGSSGAGRPGAGTRPDTGGEATGGGGLDFIINLFTLIWQKICSIPMAVDGYSISLQQIFVYGALVSIVGGFIVKFIFRR